MAQRWREVTIGDIAARTRNALVGGPFGSNLVSRDYVNTGVPVIRGQNMGERWVAGDFAFVTEQKAHSLEANLARPGDVVFTQRGTIGQVSLVPTMPYQRYLVSQSQMKLTVDPELADPLYVYYAFLTQEHQDYIRRNAIQTGVPHTNLGILRATRILLPPLPEQRAIAHILSSLDDKIELNRRMNATLEDMARALFQAWFVDFAPVRAKLAGQETGLPQEIADLFPAALVASEVGEIPEGWTRQSILAYADLLSGGTPSTSIPDYWDGEIPWVSAKDVSAAQGLFVLDTERKITPAGVEHSSTKLLPKYTTIITARGTVGAYCLLGREMAMNQTNYGLKAKPSHSDLFVYFSLANLVSELKRNAYGTIFDTVTTKTFASTSIVRPTDEIIACFDQQASPLMERILLNQQESRTLAALRDALLPKLIAGELHMTSDFGASL